MNNIYNRTDEEFSVIGEVPANFIANDQLYKQGFQAGAARRGDAEIAELVAALKWANDLTEILRMPNIEHVADAHNKAVRSLRAVIAKVRKPT